MSEAEPNPVAVRVIAQLFAGVENQKGSPDNAPDKFIRSLTNEALEIAADVPSPFQGMLRAERSVRNKGSIDSWSCQGVVGGKLLYTIQLNNPLTVEMLEVPLSKK